MVVREDAARLEQYIQNEIIREPSKDKLRLSQDQLVGLSKGKMLMMIIFICTKYKYSPICKIQQQQQHKSNRQIIYACFKIVRPSPLFVCLSMFSAAALTYFSSCKGECMMTTEESKKKNKDKRKVFIWIVRHCIVLHCSKHFSSVEPNSFSFSLSFSSSPW